MHPQPGTIDLGELSHGEPAELEVPWLARRRSLRWRGRSWQAAGAAAALTLALGSVTAGAAPARPALTMQFRVHALDYQLDQDNLYVVDRAPTRSEPTLTAYALADGAMRWAIETLPGLGSSSWVSTWFGPLLAISQVESSDNYSLREQTTRLDRDTGRVVWQVDGSPMGVSGDVMLMTDLLPTDQRPTDVDFQPAYLLTGIDIDSGAPLWSFEVLSGWRHQLSSGSPSRLVTMPPDGRRLISYDPATGEQLASAELPSLGHGEPELAVTGSLAIVMSIQAAEPVWMAYDVDTLRHRWTLGPAPDLGAWPSECGQLLCLTGQAPRAFDPATGQLRWSADWAPPQAGGWFDMYRLPSPQLAGQLILSHTTGEGGPDDRHEWLVDAATGELVLDLAPWTFSLPGFILNPTQTDPMPGWSGEGRFWIGRIRPDLSGVDPIAALEVPGAADSSFPQCTTAPPHVVCATEVITRNVGMSGYTVTVWRLRA